MTEFIVADGQQETGSQVVDDTANAPDRRWRFLDAPATRCRSLPVRQSSP
jgi:hypothetical protein